MIDFSQLSFKKLILHKVGNKARNEGIEYSDTLISLESELLRDIMLDYFLSPFKIDEYYRFHREQGLEEHPMFNLCNMLFENKDQFVEISSQIAGQLYESTRQPKVKPGELFVTYFSDCLLEDELVDCIGIFKSEVKQLFLKTEPILGFDQGINIKKLDKGCLIFKTQQEEGYRLLMVDKTSRTEVESAAWKEEFLEIERIQDAAFDTQSYLSLCMEYGEEEFADKGGKRDQVLFVNKSINYFTEHENFDLEEFATNVIEAPGQIDTFKEYKNTYEERNGVLGKTDFRISQPAVKSIKRKFRSLIQLDTNIDIKISPKEDPEVAEKLIERGFDENRAMFFYKVFFNEEL